MPTLSNQFNSAQCSIYSLGLFQSVDAALVTAWTQTVDSSVQTQDDKNDFRNCFTLVKSQPMLLCYCKALNFGGQSYEVMFGALNSSIFAC